MLLHLAEGVDRFWLPVLGPPRSGSVVTTEAAGHEHVDTLLKPDVAPSALAGGWNVEVEAGVYADLRLDAMAKANAAAARFSRGKPRQPTTCDATLEPICSLPRPHRRVPL